MRQEKLELIAREIEKLPDAQLDLALHFLQFLAHAGMNGTAQRRPVSVEQPTSRKSWLGPNPDKPLSSSIKYDEES